MQHNSWVTVCGSFAVESLSGGDPQLDARTIQDVDSLTFGADGGALYFSAGGDILEIPVGIERVAALVCGRAGRRLTEAEWSRYLGDVAYRETCP